MILVYVLFIYFWYHAFRYVLVRKSSKLQGGPRRKVHWEAPGWALVDLLLASQTRGPWKLCARCSVWKRPRTSRPFRAQLTCCSQERPRGSLKARPKAKGYPLPPAGSESSETATESEPEPGSRPRVVAAGLCSEAAAKAVARRGAALGV